MGSMYTVRQSPADGHPAGGSSSSCSHRPAQMSAGGSSSTGLRHQTSSPTGNGAYLEGNRSASSPSPERQDAARPSSKNPLTWTVDDVVWFVKDADPQALGPHVELFRKHGLGSPCPYKNSPHRRPYESLAHAAACLLHICQEPVVQELGYGK
uniref:Scm polycomb group protein like 4 n=1 Tax=Cyanistes caeruleus TaxID=156563 RepID=A0A8C0ZCU7_CYACU